MKRLVSHVVDGVVWLIRWLRRHLPLMDRVIKTLEHYGQVQGGVLSGGITYYGFLSFFPLLAVAFAVVGYISVAYPRADNTLVQAIQQVFPGIVTQRPHQGTISLNQIEHARTTVGIIGFVGLIYSGLGWLSALRSSLQSTFCVPANRRGNFFVKKATDLVVMVVLGIVMLLSVGVSSVLQGVAGRVVDLVGLSDSIVGTPLVRTVGVLLGILTSLLLFLLMYRLLGSPPVGWRALLAGAFVGAVGFEVLKLLVVYVIGGIGGSAFAPLAIAITLVVWINYGSRLVLYGASWAMTSPRNRQPPELVVGRMAAQTARADIADADARQPVPAGFSIDGSTDSPVDGRRRIDGGSLVIGAALGAALSRLLGPDAQGVSSRLSRLRQRLSRCPRR